MLLPPTTFNILFAKRTYRHKKGIDVVVNIALFVVDESINTVQYVSVFHTKRK
jgi:hypothetical protein